MGTCSFASWQAIGSRWVFQVKLNVDGSFERCEARLVAKGYSQRYGIDFEETFSPVVKMSTVRCVIALAACRKWKLFQLDVNNAFLHGDLIEEVYMQVPEGYLNPLNLVCRLRKSVYGLRQSSRRWSYKLATELIAQGFVQSKNDYSLFTYTKGTDITILIVYVDDIVITGSTEEHIAFIKHHLDVTFTIKDLGILHYFLGIEITYVPDGIVLSQKKFSTDLLNTCDFSIPTTTVSPLPLHLKLSLEDGDPFHDPALYRSLVGKLNYLTHTRPDLSYTVQTLSQFMHLPRVPHFTALLRTLSYISNTIGQGLLMKGS